jgi:acetyl-CoA carboxylase biotin carboxyl carrier protein
MDLEQIRAILGLVREHELTEFEIEHDGLRLRVRKDLHGAQIITIPAAPVSPAATASSAAVSAPAAVAATAEPVSADGEIELAVVKSPIVGTFYRSSEPSAPAFVEVGTSVKKGDVLCIIEAMKLMNEIDSEYEGEIVSVYVESGQAVQYGERLFAIRTK